MVDGEKTQQTITRLVKEFYEDDNRQLFEQHGWKWQGNQSMNARATLIKNTYGSIHAFEDSLTMDSINQLDLVYGSLHNNLKIGNAWLVGYEVGLEKTWEPTHWGADGFSDRYELQKFLTEAKNGALFICYDSTSGEPIILGIYQYDTTELVNYKDHISAAAYDSMSDEEHQSWKHVFRAVRCWELSGDDSLNAADLFRSAYEQSKELDAAKIDSSNQLMKLETTNWKPVTFFKSPSSLDIFENNLDFWITSFWGWGPESWGCVGFTQKGRRDKIYKETSDPFIMVIYGTESSKTPKEIRGKVAGFYVVTKNSGHRNEFTDKSHHDLEPQKWIYSLEAIRAFEIIDEYRPSIRDFDPSIHQGGRSLSVSKNAAKLPPQSIEKLKSLPLREVEVFGQNKLISPDIIAPKTAKRKGYVRGGAFRKGGYIVGEPKNTEKELYILKLKGKTSDYLGRNDLGKSIYKVGLSISPNSRLDAFNHSLPRGAFSWEIFRSTRRDGDNLYSDFSIAEKGEMAMKKFLGEDPGSAEMHLDREFYLASDKEIENAWQAGRNAAFDAQNSFESEAQ